MTSPLLNPFNSAFNLPALFQQASGQQPAGTFTPNFGLTQQSLFQPNTPQQGLDPTALINSLLVALLFQQLLPGLLGGGIRPLPGPLPGPLPVPPQPGANPDDLPGFKVPDDGLEAFQTLTSPNGKLDLNAFAEKLGIEPKQGTLVAAMAHALEYKNGIGIRSNDEGVSALVDKTFDPNCPADKAMLNLSMLDTLGGKVEHTKILDVIAQKYEKDTDVQREIRQIRRNGTTDAAVFGLLHKLMKNADDQGESLFKVIQDEGMDSRTRRLSQGFDKYLASEKGQKSLQALADGNYEDIEYTTGLDRLIDRQLEKNPVVDLGYADDSPVKLGGAKADAEAASDSQTEVDSTAGSAGSSQNTSGDTSENTQDAASTEASDQATEDTDNAGNAGNADATDNSNAGNAGNTDATDNSNADNTDNTENAGNAGNADGAGKSGQKQSNILTLLNTTLDDLDGNNDGTVTLDEVVAAIENKTGKTLDAGQKNRLRRVLDTDNSGTISQAELDALKAKIRQRLGIKDPNQSPLDQVIENQARRTRELADLTGRNIPNRPSARRLLAQDEILIN